MHFFFIEVVNSFFGKLSRKQILLQRRMSHTDYAINVTLEKKTAYPLKTVFQFYTHIS